MQYKIFVSYSTHDIAHVELLMQQLSDTPIDVFVAEHSVNPSENLGAKISKAIEECDLFVVLWSENAKNSGWVSQEIGRADALKKTILPLVLTEGLTLPGFISNLKYLSIYEEPSSAILKARESIVNLYNQKTKMLETKMLAQVEAKKQKGKNDLAVIAIGAFVLWAFSK
ncbi:MAG: toll/interleukin-1 receptor domain-containing protein [Piscirickettsiaceae bacterium]|nr:toll/interleukin-1 receptor domain-containing protein [Piscirickettsiaceae bacterium]